MDLRYSTNCGSTLTKGLEVYLVGTIDDSDGLLYLEDIWWTQTKPTTADNKVYVLLGIAYSNHQIYLSAENTPYMFYDGELRTLGDIDIIKARKDAKRAQDTADNITQDLAENYLNTDGVNAAIAIAAEEEASARERALQAKLDSFSGTGSAYWDTTKGYSELHIEATEEASGEKYGIVLGPNGIEFQYKDLAAASINQDRLIIDKTVVLDEMQVGDNKWTWKIDPDDGSIYLKWIG